MFVIVHLIFILIFLDTFFKILATLYIYPFFTNTSLSRFCLIHFYILILPRNCCELFRETYSTRPVILTSFVIVSEIIHGKPVA